MSEKVFWVINATRSVHTRLARTQAPVRHRFKQFILGGDVRLVRNRPHPISEVQLHKFHDELYGKWKQGAILVREGHPEGPLYLFEKPEAIEPVPEPEAKKAPKPEPVPEQAKVEPLEPEPEVKPPPKPQKRNGRKKK